MGMGLGMHGHGNMHGHRQCIHIHGGSHCSLTKPPFRFKEGRPFLLMRPQAVGGGEHPGYVCDRNITPKYSRRGWERSDGKRASGGMRINKCHSRILAWEGFLCVVTHVCFLEEMASSEKRQLLVVNDSTDSLATVKTLAFHCCMLPLIGKALVEVELLLINDLSLDNQTYSLCVPLRPDNLVCGFSMQNKDGPWIEACAVPVQQARRAALAKPQGEQHENSWCGSIELPFEAPVQVKFGFLCNMVLTGTNVWSLELPFCFQRKIDVTATEAKCFPVNSFAVKSEVIEVRNPECQSFKVDACAQSRIPLSAPRSILVDHRFYCLIPHAAIDALLPSLDGKIGGQHVLILYDLSMSCKSLYDPGLREAFLRNVEREYCNAGSPNVLFSLVGFSQMGTVLVNRGSLEEVLTALKGLSFAASMDFRFPPHPSSYFK